MKAKSMIIGELPLIIEWMIENALLQTILNFILDQKIRPWWTLQNDSQFDPFMWIVKNQKMRHSTKKQKG